MKKFEIRVRPVIRYSVSEYHCEDHGDGRESGGSRGLGEFDSFQQAQEIASVMAAHLGADLIQENTSPEQPVATSIGDLMRVLGSLDPTRVPMSLEPPFVGVRVIAQESGAVLIAPPPRDFKVPEPRVLKTKGDL